MDSIAALAILFSFLTSAAVERDVKVKIFFVLSAGTFARRFPPAVLPFFFLPKQIKRQSPINDSLPSCADQRASIDPIMAVKPIAVEGKFRLEKLGYNEIISNRFTVLDAKI